MRFDKLDNNLSVKPLNDKPDTQWFDSCNKPFNLYGLLKPTKEEGFLRMPLDIAKGISNEIYELCKSTAGGRLRFSIDSPYIAISSVMENVNRIPHMANVGVHGFDLYVNYNGKDVFVSSFIPNLDICDGYSSYIDISPELHNGMHE